MSRARAKVRDTRRVCSHTTQSRDGAILREWIGGVVAVLAAIGFARRLANRPQPVPAFTGGCVRRLDDNRCREIASAKAKLLERLQEGPGPNECDKIDRLIAQLNTALTMLDEAGLGTPGDAR